MNSIQQQILQQQLLKTTFRQHKINAPAMPGIVIAPQKAVEFLTRGYQMGSMAPLELSVLDKPAGILV
jgi:hypothetical protein